MLGPYAFARPAVSVETVIAFNIRDVRLAFGTGVEFMDRQLLAVDLCSGHKQSNHPYGSDADECGWHLVSLCVLRFPRISDQAYRQVGKFFDKNADIGRRTASGVDVVPTIPPGPPVGLHSPTALLTVSVAAETRRDTHNFHLKPAWPVRIRNALYNPGACPMPKGQLSWLPRMPAGRITIWEAWHGKGKTLWRSRGTECRIAAAPGGALGKPAHSQLDYARPFGHHIEII